MDIFNVGDTFGNIQVYKKTATQLYIKSLINNKDTWKKIHLDEYNNESILIEDSTLDWLNIGGNDNTFNFFADKVKNKGIGATGYSYLLKAPMSVQPVTEDKSQHTEILSVEYSKALTLNHKIKVNSTVMVNVMYELGLQLMEMRDKKLFKELGYTSFKEYIAKEVPLARTQSYACITIAENLPKEFVHSSEQIGIKKMELLAKMEEEDRKQLLETVNVEDTTVKQLKAEIDKLKADNEGLKNEVSNTNELLEAVRNSNESQVKSLEEEISSLEDEKYNLECQIKELEERPVEVAVKEDTETSMELSNLRRLQATYDKKIREYMFKIQELQNENAGISQEYYRKGFEAGKSENSSLPTENFKLLNDLFQDAFLKYFSCIRNNKNPEEWRKDINATMRLFDQIRKESLGE